MPDSLQSLSKTLEAIRQTSDIEEIAILMGLSAELFAQSSCDCERVEEVYEGQEESVFCQRGMGQARDEMVGAFRDALSRLKG